MNSRFLAMEIHDFQQLMKEIYFHNDLKRGPYRTAMWISEEIGELMSELKKSEEIWDKNAIGEEMADVIAWIASLANLLEIDLAQAMKRKYPNKCIKCGNSPCVCEHDLL